ncbi:uncharacterized protein LOC111249531 isoform X1 [Varroa destructor]|uniref:C2H2-type domain-containing protein n=1 Tax=Varroa destructor TaxID=109461 RepID=A0A7M7JZU3_VARDE|nr:uncharacterized protein LOC111249531 isoform X1 [Varroa destructor]
MQPCSSKILRCGPCGKTFNGEAPYTQHMVSQKHRKKLANDPMSPPPQDPVKVQKILNKANIYSIPQLSVAGSSGPAPNCHLSKENFTNEDDNMDHSLNAEHHQNCVKQEAAAAAASSTSSSKSTSLIDQTLKLTNLNSEADLLERILQHHQRTFLLCSADEPFAEFIQRHKVFETQT